MQIKKMITRAKLHPDVNRQIDDYVLIYPSICIEKNRLSLSLSLSLVCTSNNIIYG